MQTDEKVLDEWELTRQRQKERLIACQQERHLTSCLQCDQILHCEIRDAYVQAVYDSMNKGTGGGFEF